MYKRLREIKLWLMKCFTSDCVEIFFTCMPISTHVLACIILIVLHEQRFFILKIPGGGEKQESKQRLGGHRARWRTMPHAARN